MPREIFQDIPDGASEGKVFLKDPQPSMGGYTTLFIREEPRDKSPVTVKNLTPITKGSSAKSSASPIVFLSLSPGAFQVAGISISVLPSCFKEHLFWLLLEGACCCCVLARQSCSAGFAVGSPSGPVLAFIVVAAS
ncbi:hypothetical protein U1Q18_008346 [Sarracenia purpurea var. burkii]